MEDSNQHKDRCGEEENVAEEIVSWNMKRSYESDGANYDRYD